MTNFWAGLTKSEITELIRMHKDVATMNEQLIQKRKEEAAEALRDHLLEAEALWLSEHLGDLGAISIGECAKLGEEISAMAWLDPNMEASLIVAKAQAGDGYRQTVDALSLFRQIYDFLVRLDKTTHKAAWINRLVILNMRAIELFDPDLKEKYS